MELRKGASLLAGFAACSGLLMLAGTVQAIQIDKLVVIGASNTAAPVAGNEAVKDIPMGQSAGEKVSLLPEDAKMSDEEDLFGGKGGYIHINAMLQGEYTDNLYNVDRNKTTNFLTTLSPAIWFTLPRKKDIPVTLAPNNTSPGGLALQSKDYEGTDRFQAYALGGLDFEFYSSDSELNTINGLGEGLFRYNMRGGLSLMVVDRYTRDADRFDVGSDEGVSESKFDSNIAVVTADWNITEKLRAKFDYSNFYLAYDEDLDSYKDRVDNAFDLYGYFNYSVKTAFFLEGKLVDVQYDTETVNDNQQYFIFGGIKWDTTEKVSLMAKAGVQNKEFDDNVDTATNRGDYSGLAVDIQAVYKITEKTKISLDAYRTNEETDSTVASDKTVLGATFGYNQKFTDKISGSFAANFEDAEYTQLIVQDRDDTTFSLKPAAQYLFREWLMGEISYQFEKRDSTDDLFDYQTNTVFANIKFAL
ncbi:MAG: outer membrane beta-barrel protein [Proteobacteria bacterium]|nr:outer membrane beta-barrel protein [Pseudomonadota bacterium]